MNDSRNIKFSKKFTQGMKFFPAAAFNIKNIQNKIYAEFPGYRVTGTMDTFLY